jgi:glycosyltransferase involved in cell wall biosynthesis
MERSVNTRASLIIAPTHRIATLLVDRQRVPARKVVVIPYCFDPAKYARVQTEAVEVQRRLMGLNDCFTIGTFGRLYPDKGHRYVLDALPAIANAVPSLKYLIVGEGKERPQLERQVNDLGLGQMVTFLGWRTDVPELMAAVDVVVQPSVQEALSQSMAEALFLGRPLVITNVSGANELVPDKSIGVVVPCQDSAALASAVIALEGDPQRRAAVANAGMRHALASFTIDAVVPRYEAAYRSTPESTRLGLRRSAARRRLPR